jgi:hypothetical protein
MIYLIGVNHYLGQRKRHGEDGTDYQQTFQSVVESAIQSIHPDLLAEEDHPDFLSGADSILLEIASIHGMEDRHRFVDPNRDERKKIGDDVSKCISTSVQGIAHLILCHYPKREEFWLQKLQDSLNKDILFICGWGHIESFKELLARNGISYSVLAKRIGASPSEIRLHDDARSYIKDNPAEFRNPTCPRQRQFPNPLG